MLASREWTAEEDSLLLSLKKENIPDRVVAQTLNRSEQSVRGRRRRIQEPTYQISESPYPKFDAPLVMEGNALVLPDVEIPYHNADFLNRCIELAHKWKVDQCIVAGDYLHVDSLSRWGPTWTSDKNGLHESLSTELEVARKETKALSSAFKQVDFVLGNHCSRFLKALGSPIFPQEVLRLIEAGNKWRAAPYFYSILISNGEKFQIEHPNAASQTAPEKLASKYRCHILQAHSHRWSQRRDISGHYWAISMGCVVDEERLAYVSQRHGIGDAHITGAVIVRDGYPWLLSERTPWERVARM